MTNLLRIKIALWIGSARFWVPVFVLFLMSRDFSLGTIMQALSVFYILTAILEYPTGVFGDWFSHKWSLALGMLFGSVGMVSFTQVETIVGMYVSMSIFALGGSLMSGSDKALLYSATKDFTKDFASFQTISIVIATVAIALGGWMATINLALPLYITAVFGFFAVIILLTVKSDTKKITKHTPKKIIYDGLQVVRRKIIVRHLLTLSFLTGAFFFSIKWFYNPLFLEINLPLVWWGVATAGATLSIALGTFVAGKSRVIGFSTAGSVLLVSIFAIGLSQWIAVVAVAIFVSHFLRGYLETRVTVGINMLVKDHIRASVMSFESLLMRLGAAGFTAVAGFIIERTAVLGVMVFAVGMMFIFGAYSFVRLARWQSTIKV